MQGSPRWRGCLDPTTSRVYYVDTDTNQSSWDEPRHFQDAARSDGWQRLWDLEHNHPYWYHWKTGSSSWEEAPLLIPAHPPTNVTGPAGPSAMAAPLAPLTPDAAAPSVVDQNPQPAVPAPIRRESPVPNDFLQQQLQRRGRAPSSTSTPVTIPARITLPVNKPPTQSGRKSVDNGADAKVTAPIEIKAKVSIRSATVVDGGAHPQSMASPSVKPGTARKSTEIKISGADSIDALTNESAIESAPIAIARPQPIRKAVAAASDSLNPRDRRGISHRSSSLLEREPTPTTTAIVSVPAVKRRPLPVPELVSQGQDASDQERVKGQRLTEHIVAEIVSSERSYVQSLQILVDVVIERIAREEPLSALMDDARVAMFFSNAEQVVSLNSTLLTDLELLVGSADAPAAIGALFLRYVNLFSVYTQYARHYGQACEVLQAKNDTLEAVFRDLQADPMSLGQTLFSLGIMPIQRIPRYCLLLRELQRNLPEPVAQIDDALVQVEMAASAINEAIRERETREDMLKTASASKCGAELLKTGHHLIKTGPLSKMDRNGNLKKYTFMLFADQLRYSNRSISLDGCTIEREPFQLTKRGLHGWVVKTPERSFMVCADDEATGNDWIQVIEAECSKFRSAPRAEPMAPILTNSDLCSVCATRFTMLNRGRHCDMCGKSVCQNCCVKVRRGGPKVVRVCHFCRTSSDGDDVIVVEGAASKSATMTEVGSTLTTDEPIDSHDRIRNHLAAALEELKLKVAVADPQTPAAQVAMPEREPPQRRSTRKALDRLAAKTSGVRSPTASRTDLARVAPDVQVRQDLMADVSNWVKHHRKPSSKGNDDVVAVRQERAVIREAAAVVALPVQGPITSLDQERSRLIDLEIAFLQQLEEFARVFATPLLDDMMCAALPCSLAIVFDTIQNLQAIHAKFCTTLQDGDDLARALLMLSELVRRPYLVYCKHYGEAVSELDDANLHSRIALCARVAGIASDAVMLLQKHVARPMQRLPLYILHAERVRDLLQDQEQDAFDTVAKAHASFHDAWQRMSDIVELRASYETLKSIEAQFDAGGSSAVHLAVPSRVFVRWGMLDKVDRRGRVERLAFHLFSDVLLYSEKVPAGFRLRRQIPLRQCQLIRDDDRLRHAHAFQLRLVNSSKSLIIAPVSDSERRDWVAKINTHIARLLVRKSFGTGSEAEDGMAASVDAPIDESQGAATQASSLAGAETWTESQGASPERYAMFYDDGAVASLAVEKHPRHADSLWTLYLTEQGDEYFHDSVTGRFGAFAFTSDPPSRPNVFAIAVLFRTTWTKPSKFAILPQSG